MTVEVFTGPVALGVLGRAVAARTYLRHRRAGMVRLAPIARLRPALELHGLDVRPGDDEITAGTTRMVSVVIEPPDGLDKMRTATIPV